MVNLVITTVYLQLVPGEGGVSRWPSPNRRRAQARARVPVDSARRRSAQQLIFHLKALGSIPRALRRYPREIIRLLAEVSFGSGALAVIGGTIGVMVSLSLFTGTVVGLQGYAALNQLGTAALTGFISAYFNTREIAPLVAGLALSATVGCGFTAQLGSMRIREEIDALEVMAVRSVPYLVTCRVIAGFIAVIPLYVDRPADVLPRLAHRDGVLLRPVGRHLRPLLRAVPAAGRHPAVVPEGDRSSRSSSS